MRNVKVWIGALALACGVVSGLPGMGQGVAVAASAVQPAGNAIENLQVSQQTGSVIVKLSLKQPLANPPDSNWPKIAVTA